MLVGHARDGLESAMEELVSRYQDRIAGFVYSLVGREDAVADLCHNVFVKMIGPAALTKADRSRFLSALDTEVQKALRTGNA